MIQKNYYGITFEDPGEKVKFELQTLYRIKYTKGVKRSNRLSYWGYIIQVVSQ